VFISTWYNTNSSSDDATIDEIVEMYNPISIEVEKQDLIVNTFLKHIMSPFENLATHDTRPLSVFAMFYKIMKANRLRMMHEKVNSFNYDVIIRTRFDLQMESPVDIIIPEKNHIYIPKGWDHRGGYNDLFAIGDSESMTYYSNVFNNLLPMLRTGNLFHPESLLKIHLDMGGHTLIRPLMNISFHGMKIHEHASIY
jgi:hypothetical protein